MWSSGVRQRDLPLVSAPAPIVFGIILSGMPPPARKLGRFTLKLLREEFTLKLRPEEVIALPVGNPIRDGIGY